MLKILYTTMLILSINAMAFDIGPKSVSPTGELWVCLSSVATLQKCSDNDSDICKGVEKIITIAPKVKLFGSEPIDPESTDSCARLY